MKKVYKKLSKEDKEKGIIFKSTLSVNRFETIEDTTHKVFNTDYNKYEKIKRLKEDKFFNKSHFKFNIIRT